MTGVEKRSNLANLESGENGSLAICEDCYMSGTLWALEPTVCASHTNVNLP